jgi:hypothetical protein
LTSLYFSDLRTEDRPKSPPASNVDLIPRGMPQHEAEKLTEESAVARGILGCHSVLAVSSFVLEYPYVVEYFILVVSL